MRAEGHPIPARPAPRRYELLAEAAGPRSAKSASQKLLISIPEMHLPLVDIIDSEHHILSRG
jgi:hypothetical protein